MAEWADAVLPDQIAQTDTYDGATHNIVQPNNGDLLLVYTQNDSAHFSTDGRVVARRSTDGGLTWSLPQELHNDPERDATSPSVVNHPNSDRIDVFDVSFRVEEPSDETGVPERAGFQPYRITSTDHGQSWSKPVPISDHLHTDGAAPFGGWTNTAAGTMTAFYSRKNELELLLTEDAGESWISTGRIAASPHGRELAEPVPTAITDQKVLIVGRENVTADFYAITSHDGGKSWSHPVFFNPTGMISPCPIWAKTTGPNELTAVWGDRDERMLYAVRMSAHLVWQDPTTLADEPRQRLHRQIGAAESASYWSGDAGDFGYPTFVQTESSGTELLVTFYDEGPKPNLWHLPLSR